MILVDTDIIIWILRGDESLRDTFKNIVKETDGYIFVTPVQFAETYAGVRPKEEKRVDKFFSSLKTTVVDKDTGKLAGVFMKNFRKSHNVTLADALVAASSRLNHFKLWTNNRKHYPMLDEDEFL
jgi:predicted nucleic acid-binding protein